MTVRSEVSPSYDATPVGLSTIPALGIVGDDAIIAAALQILERRMKESHAQGPAFTSPEESFSYLRLRLADLPQEQFMTLFLDNRHRLISAEVLFYGTIDGASVHPREVVRRALELRAAAVIFAHNHPSGLVQPSQADLRITQRLKDALALIEIRVLDHVIIGEGFPYSMAEHGVL